MNDLARLRSLSAVAVLALAACAPPSSSEELGSQPLPTPAPSTPAPEPRWSGPHRAGAVVVAWTAEGDLALVDGASGGVIAASSGAHLGGVRDAALDLAHDRVITFEGDPDGSWGEVATYALDRRDGSFAIGPRAHRAWIDGDARVAAAPGGILVFSDGPARQWRVLRDDEMATASATGARPISLVVRNDRHHEAPDLVLDALVSADDDGTLAIQGATVHAGVISLGAPEPLPVSPPPPAARLAAVPALDAEVLVDADDATLGVRALRGAVVAPRTPIGLGAAPGRPEAALAVGEGDTVAVLTSDPPRVVVMGLAVPARRRRGELPALADVTAVDLEAPVRVEDRFFSRDLAAIDARTLLVATNAGVVALRVVGSARDLALERVSTFDGAALRGPIAGVLP